MPTIIQERHESFAIVRLNRPEKRNALSQEMMIELGAIFASVPEYAESLERVARLTQKAREMLSGVAV